MKNKKFIQGIILGVVITAIIFLSFGNMNSFGFFESFKVKNKMDTIYNTLDQKYVDEIDKKDVIDGIYKGMAYGIGDIYTTYLNEDEYQEFLESSQGLFDGIGLEITVNENNNLVIVGIMENGPSYNSGIMVGDIILKVDGQDIQGLTINDVVKSLKGEKGTHVNVTVLRPEENKEYTFDIVRNEVKIDTIEKGLFDNIGYIRIIKFGKDTYDDFVKAYNELRNECEGLIIDVRDNPGGLFDASDNIADFLLPEGLTVYTVDKNGTREDFYSDKNCIDIPFCMLVNENSASASEILAGAVSDTDAAKLIGKKTYGKGLVQGIFDLNDGTALKITIQKYYTPSGVCIQGKGIIPDYEVENPVGADFCTEEDYQFQKALEVIKSEI